MQKALSGIHVYLLKKKLTLKYAYNINSMLAQYYFFSPPRSINRGRKNNKLVDTLFKD